jgi:hypothetical protein
MLNTSSSWANRMVSRWSSWGFNRQAEDERAVDHHAGLVAGPGEPAHLLERDPFFDALEDLLVAALVAHQEQAQPGILEGLDGVVVEVRPAVADQVNPSGASFLAISRARGRLAVKVSSSKKNSFTCGKELLHVGHFVGDILRRADAVFVAADGLGPEAEGALGRATAPGVKAE